MRKKTKVKPEFILNEPPVEIKNGSNRKSTIVYAEEFPARVQRQKVNKLLMLLDPDNTPLESLSIKDVDLLKQIAFEGTISNNTPALRYNAILKLASFPSSDTLNILSYLVNQGEDHYIKSHALLALGQSGIELSIPIIARFINDKNPLISNAAQRALIKLVNHLGIERMQHYFVPGSGLSYKIIGKIISGLNKKKTKRQTRTKGTGDNYFFNQV